MNPEKFFIKPEEVEEFTTVYQIMDHARRRYPTKAAYRQMETRTEESSVTFGQFAENTEALRAALWQRGCADSHIAILGETSQEWISVYIAVVSGVGVCVPIDKELPPETMVKQLNFAEIRTLFCSKGCLKKLQKVLPECETLETVVVMRGKGTETLEGCDSVLYLPDLLAEGCAPGPAVGEALNALLDAVTDTALVEGAYYCSGYSAADTGALVQKFLSDYAAAYNGATPNMFDAQGYDAAWILCDAIAKAEASGKTYGSDEYKAEIIAAMKATDSDYVTGHVSYDDHNDPQKTAAIINIVGGEEKFWGSY